VNDSLLARWRRPRRPSTVRAYLFFIAVICTLPLALFGGYFAYRVVSESAQQDEAAVRERLFLMRSAIDQRIEKVIVELQVLANSPDLQSGDLERFKSHAAETSRLIGGITVLLCDRDGNQFLNTRSLAPGAPIPKRQNLEALRRAWDTKAPAVSDLYPAVVDAKPVVSIEVPVIVAGEVRYMLTAGIVSTTFSDVMDQYVPEGAIGSIIDRNGVLVARRPLGEGLVGKPTIPEVARQIGAAAAYWIPAISREGLPTYTSLLRSDLTGWSASLAVSRQAIDGPVRRTLILFTVLGIVALLLGLAFARLLAERFLHSFAVLQRHVRLLGSRQAVTPVHGPIAEINAMDETLYEVANHLGEIMKRQEVLLGEINHRVKNTLATINAIARLTRTSSASVPEFVEGFQDRVFALARAYDLLTRTDWTGADLGSLVETTLAPYARSNRIRIEGSPVALRPKFALAMAAAVQELTTNAAKYGSLSNANGTLEVCWREERGAVRFDWVESGGPPVTVPTRRGFGTKLIQDLLANETGWTVDLDYAASGLRCHILMQQVTAADEALAAKAAEQGLGVLART
jgi:two-component sensor histidine kinase